MSRNGNKEDGSTDQTAAIIASFQDPRLRPIRLAHGGLVRALNAGLTEAQAPWVARLDADDTSHPQRLSQQWRALTRQPGAVLSFTSVNLVGDHETVRQRGHLPRTRALQALKLCYVCPLVHSSVMFQRRVVQQVGGYHANDFPAEDFGLWGV
jgi:glycosyltransferase involved in cell wall biosynthesis